MRSTIYSLDEAVITLRYLVRLAARLFNSSSPRIDRHCQCDLCSDRHGPNATKQDTVDQPSVPAFAGSTQARQSRDTTRSILDLSGPDSRAALRIRAQSYFSSKLLLEIVVYLSSSGRRACPRRNGSGSRLTQICILMLVMILKGFEIVAAHSRPWLWLLFGTSRA